MASNSDVRDTRPVETAGGIGWGEMVDTMVLGGSGGWCGSLEMVDRLETGEVLFMAGGFGW